MLPEAENNLSEAAEAGGIQSTLLANLESRGNDEAYFFHQSKTFISAMVLQPRGNSDMFW